MLALAGCGGPEVEGDEEVDSMGSAVINGRYAYSYKSTFSWYAQADATFTVPNNPAANNGQTLYYYVGLWTSSAMTNGLTAQLRYSGGGWTIRACSGLNTACSAAQTVYAGDSIVAQMNQTGCNAAGVCSWVVFLEDWTHFTNTSASYSPGVAFKFATPWAEQVTNLWYCRNLPAWSPISATGRLFTGPNFTQDLGTWSAWNNTSGSPACYPNALIGPNPGETDIYQTPSP
jgi:enamine deaminase RidA (YjgF/YER057c/UK114 family)